MIIALFLVGLAITFIALAAGGAMAQLTREQPERFKNMPGCLPILWITFGVGFALIVIAMAMYVWGMLGGPAAK